MSRRTRSAGGFDLLPVVLVTMMAVIGAAQAVQAGEPAGSRASLPDGLLDQVFPYYSLSGVSQREAEALFGSAIAAVYFPERGEVHVLASDGLQFAREWLKERETERPDSDSKAASAAFELEEKIGATASTSLRTFLASLPGETKGDDGPSEESYLVKFPTFRDRDSLPTPTEPLRRLPVVEAAKDSYYIYQDFEGDVWSYWSRLDNTGGQYRWGIRSCDSHSGSYSADAARGGSQGSSLGCDSPYPKSLVLFMSSEACQTVLPYWKATLEFQLNMAIDQDGEDGFGVLAEDSDGHVWGWTFWGTTSEWDTMIFNLRQWYVIGDLGANYCNTLHLGFVSDTVSNSGFGARVDDLYLWFGDTVGSDECEILADPESGPAPLTVSFRASTNMFDPDFHWRFGDGGTSEEMDPVHVYTSPGTYQARLETFDNYGTTCYSSQTIVVGQGTCTYSLSPTSANYSASSGNGSFSVSTQAGCTWNATANNNWIHVTGGASGTGSGTVSYSVDANGGSSSRTGTITAGGRTFTITQSGAPSCTYSISPTSRSFDENGGTGTVSVSTTAGCSWTAASNNGWIHVTSGASGTGTGNVGYRVDANSGGPRTGTMTIAGHAFTVTQSSGGSGETFTYQVAGIAHAGGAGGSVWRSTLCVTNRSGSTANVTLVYRMASNSVTRTHVLQNGRIKEWADVAVSLFNQSANTSGAIEITSDAPVMVVARTYNEAPDGTFGQGMPGNDDLETLAPGQLGVLPQLKKSSAFRTNVGLMNHGTAACNVRIKLFSETGSQLGSTIDTSVTAKQWKQINDVFNEAGVGQCAIGYATIEVRTAGGKIWAYGSVVDNGTGDPTTIPLFIE